VALGAALAWAAIGCKLEGAGDKHACHANADCDDGRTCAAAGVCVPGVATVAAGEVHTCVLRVSGEVECWGTNDAGQVGDGGPSLLLPLSPGNVVPDVRLSGPAKALGVGSRHGCALLEGATVECWGSNDVGQLGQTPNPRQPVPIDLGGGHGAVALAVGAAHSCAVLDDGRLKCWGDNESGQLGLGDTNNRGDQPGEMGDALPAVDLGPGRAVQAIAAGTLHTCALLDGGQLACWGDNHYGQLGLGTTVNVGDQAPLAGAPPLVDVGRGRRVLSVSAGGGHTCAVLDTDQVKCWGYNASGQLGLGTPDLLRGDVMGEMGDLLPFVDLGAGRRVTALAAGNNHTCALLDDGRLKCWGLDINGELGLDSSGDRGNGAADMGDALPEVDLGTGRRALAVAVAAGANHSCAVLDTHELKCWGDNESGQLGLPDVTNSRGDGAEGTKEMGDSLPVVDLGP
jgi:alpha-tubulin suppressor-like RCC1 family protein